MNVLRQWLAWWHGAGASNQYDYYRCDACRRIVTWTAIRRGGCSCRESSKIRPAVLTCGEKARLLLAPWSVSR